MICVLAPDWWGRIGEDRRSIHNRTQSTAWMNAKEAHNPRPLLSLVEEREEGMETNGQVPLFNRTPGFSLAFQIYVFRFQLLLSSAKKKLPPTMACVLKRASAHLCTTTHSASVRVA